MPVMRPFASAWRGSGAEMATARVAKKCRQRERSLMRENMVESWRRRARRDKNSEEARVSGQQSEIPLCFTGTRRADDYFQVLLTSTNDIRLD